MIKVNKVKKIKARGAGCGYCGQLAPGGYLLMYEDCNEGVCSKKCANEITGEPYDESDNPSNGWRCPEKEVR